jgi:hypothetical protein
MKKLRITFNYFIALIFVFISSCNNKTESFTPKERSLVKDSVQRMVNSITKDLSLRGPIAWLTYFENTPDFFMASNGQLEFSNIDTAKSFINNILVKIIPKIELRWSNIKIDALTNQFASISAVYHENISDSTGKTTPYDGYFTAIAHQTSEGWKLHNAHWSSMMH